MEISLESPSLHAHRLDNNSSKLPTFRAVDVNGKINPAGVAAITGSQIQSDNARFLGTLNTALSTSPPPRKEHARNQSTNVITTSPKRPPLHQRNSTFPGDLSPPRASITNPSSQPTNPALRSQKARRDVHAASISRNNKRPPLSMKYFETQEADTSTTDWVHQQSIPLTPTTPDESKSPSETTQPPPSRPVAENTPSRPVIKPIRGFKPSSRKSVEMNGISSNRMSIDPDTTLRALDGLDNTHRVSNQPEQDEQNSDESDLFLRAAREEELARRASNPNGNAPTRSDSRRSRIGQRQSIEGSSFNPSIARRRGSDQEVASHEGMAMALTYRPSTRDRPTALDDINRNRYYGGNSRSTPTTPKAFGSREISPESQISYGGRRPSVPDHTLPTRNSSYRQSNLSYSTPRTYNSSPLVSRTTEMHDTPETTRAAEGTESTVSTTAPSTVWDELEDLKSRIHRLELTGKLPATSGAAVSRASNERPPTATTTVTTMSSSPKRGRGNSISPTEAVSTNAQTGDAHPLLSSALAKSKPLLSPEVYKALEVTASDALAISSMMGSSGQPGPISSSQSTIGGVSTPVSDRQVRRKADSLCRSLTELCLALSEGKSEQKSSATQNSERPRSRGIEVRNGEQTSNGQRQPASTDLVRVKSTPRALSRLEARRSSLLATSSLPSPRYTPSEAGTPTQTSMAGRRTSLLRSRRGGTEEPEEDETRFRAPSRAATEIGRVRNSPREYVSQQPLPERTPSIQSSLPVRRHYVSTSLTNSGAPPLPPLSSLGGRKYLDQSTPERDTVSAVGRLAEDRAQRKSSISQGIPLGRTGSLTKRRQPNNTDSSTAGHAGRYQ